MYKTTLHHVKIDQLHVPQIGQKEWRLDQLAISRDLFGSKCSVPQSLDLVMEKKKTNAIFTRIVKVNVYSISIGRYDVLLHVESIMILE